MADENAKKIPAPLPRLSEVDKIHFRALLGSGNEYDSEKLLKCYETQLWVMNENHEWTKERFKNLTNAKLGLLRELILDQIAKEGRFSVVSPFANTCTSCRGSGELYRFKRIVKKVTCMKCIDTKDETVKCKTCKGTKKVKTFAIVSSLLSTTTCPACKGKGFFKEKQLDNPLISDEVRDEAKKLKIKLAKKEKPKSLGAEISNHSFEAEQANPPEQQIEVDQKPPS